MPTSTSPPIMVWTPGGGVPVGPVSNPPVYSQAGTTQLVEGQAYIDVVFGSIQTDDEWVLVECVVVNEIDADPLNIWPGIITDKAAAGFRLQLNGMPDSGNYYLHWAVSGANIAPTPATTFMLSGPASGIVGVPSTFSVYLPASTTGTAIVTPSDSGGGGAFSPVTVTLTTGVPSATFTYTPGSAGAKTISVTNSGGLVNPASVILTVVSAATGYSMSGPSGGFVGVASSPFTVTLTPGGGAVAGTVTVTPSDGGGGGGGTFTPTTVELTTIAPSATFTYTSASVGTKTISATNDGGLTDPGSLSYAPFVPTSITGLKLWLKADAIAGPPADGTAVGTWADSSGNGYDATQATAGLKPLFKTNRINGLPSLKFDGVDDVMATVTAMIGTVTTAATVFFVQRTNSAPAAQAIQSASGPSTGSPPTNTFGIYLPFSGNVYFDLGDNTATGRVNAAWGGNFTDFFVWSFVAGGGNMAIYRNGTTVVSSGGHTNVFTPAGLFLSINGLGASVQDADIAEILIYNSGLSSTDRGNVETYLRNKYGL